MRRQALQTFDSAVLFARALDAEDYGAAAAMLADECEHT